MPSPETLIIPGFANNVDYGEQKFRADHSNFLLYQDCPQFNWGDDNHYETWGIHRPLEFLKQYWKEKAQVRDPESIQKLADCLELHQPEVLICHSMGCLFLRNYLESFELPNSVRKILLVQADCPRNSVFKTKVPIVVVHCWWDNILWGSAILNRYVPLGISGSNYLPNKFAFLPLPEPHEQATNLKSMFDELIKRRLVK